MSLIPFFKKNPLRSSWLWAGFVGVCLLVGPGPRSFGIDDQSGLFQGQSGKASTPVPNGTSPVALPEETPTQAPGIFSALVGMIFSLAVVLTLVVVTIWGLKWVWERRGSVAGFEEGKPVQVFHTTYLAPRMSIQLVEIGSKVLVLGVGHEEIRCLDVIKDPQEIAVLKESAPSGFPKTLQRMLKNKEAQEKGERAQAAIRESHEAVGEYVQKLKNLKKKKNSNDSTTGGM